MHSALRLLLAGSAACGGSEVERAPLSFRPSLLDFGRVAVGRPTARDLEVVNVSDQPLSLLEVRPNEELIEELDVGPLIAHPGPGVASATRVLFTARASGAHTGELRFKTDVPGHELLTLPVSAVAFDAALLPSPPAIDFGRVRLGRTATATVTVVNQTDVRVRIRSLTRDMDTSAEFEASLEAIAVLEPARSFSFRVRYSPEDAGLDTGRFVVDDDDPQAEPVPFSVAGEGIEWAIEILPREIDFGTVLLGREAHREVELRNIGSSTESVDRIDFLEAPPPGFAIEPTGAPFRLAPGEDRRIRVRFAPTAPGRSSGRIRVEARALGGAVSSEGFIALTGIGQRVPAPSMEVTPRVLSYGGVMVGGEVPRSLTIANRGDANLVLRDLRIDPPGAPFSLRGPPPPALAPGNEHTLAVVFAPVVLGPAAAALAIESDDPAAPSTRIALEGLGQPDPSPQIEVEPRRIEVGRLPRDLRAQRSLAVRNTGSATLEVARIYLTASAGQRFLFSDSVALPLALAPGEARRFAIEYEDLAGAPGSHGGGLRIDTNDPDEPETAVELTAETASARAGVLELAFALSWSGDADLDLHVIRPGGAFFDRPSDACVCNPNPSWGSPSDPEDDPLLERDELSAPGPERVRVPRAETGLYRVVVHAWRAATLADARVEVLAQGELVASSARSLASGDMWEVGTLAVDRSVARPSFAPGSAPLAPSPHSSCY